MSTQPLDAKCRTRRRTCTGHSSPAFSTQTKSPTRMSFRAISSRLWRVARATVEPARRTGSSSATGVRTPVRPTWTEMARSFVSTRSAANLYAMAQRGALLVLPASRWSGSESSFTTAPSVA